MGPSAVADGEATRRRQTVKRQIASMGPSAVADGKSGERLLLICAEASMGPSAVADGEATTERRFRSSPAGFNGAVGGSRRRGAATFRRSPALRPASMGPSAVADGEPVAHAPSKLGHLLQWGRRR